MFEKTKKIATKMEEKVEKAFAPMVTAAAALGLTPTVYADNAADGALIKIINVVFKIFQYIGVVLALWGAGSLIMAFKNEDADSKTRAIMSLVVGISLIALKALFGDMIVSLIKEDVGFTSSDLA